MIDDSRRDVIGIDPAWPLVKLRIVVPVVFEFTRVRIVGSRNRDVHYGSFAIIDFS